MINKSAVFWFRRDLRFEDNCALYHALNENDTVIPIFIFDTKILNKFENKSDARVQFIYNELNNLNLKLIREFNSGITIYYGESVEIFKQILTTDNISSIYANSDYEPYSTERDSQIAKLAEYHNITFNLYKDQVIFEKSEILNQSGKTYSVFTPYSKQWKSALSKSEIPHYNSEKLLYKFKKNNVNSFPELKTLGFNKVEINYPEREIKENIIRNYHENRDFPAVEGTSRLSLHLRFGTVSIRQSIRKAIELNEKWLDELIWREFYMMILWNFPQVVTRSFKAHYDSINWRNNENEFYAWCEGKTGFPIVDAGMRQLNATSFMHNRLRMVTASFLSKQLLIDWRWGEAYFAAKLLDYELASNNGGWQWAASCGCDAVPYFRIFNPDSQTKRFDPKNEFILRWIPELESSNYCKPIVNLQVARVRVLTEYRRVVISSEARNLLNPQTAAK